MPTQAMKTSTLNVRLDPLLKARGDKVLHDNGMSTSDAVRGLWQELAEKRVLPEFLERTQRDMQQKAAKKALLAGLSGVAKGALSNATDDELLELGLARYA